MAVFEEDEGGRTRPRPFRPFRTHEEYLYAMKEDLAEWLAALYDLQLTADDFLDHLETGVVLCRHANRVATSAKRRGLWDDEETNKGVVFRPEVQPGTFHARDNVHNFIAFCRGPLKIKECLLFETDDLVMRKNEKNVVLCLLEVARRGTRFGMPAPLLVQMEKEIDAEIAAGDDGSRTTPPSSLSLRGDSDEGGHEADDDSESEPAATTHGPQQQIVTNDLRSLHERVAELLNRCSCPAQFPMLRVGDGKYRIGETQLLIFVRILRNHVMVRVGGGWDTLEHYLDKHDPCRCKSGRRISVNRVSPSNSGSIHVHLNSHRPLSSGGTPSSSRSSSVPPSPPSRRRSFDLSRLSSDDRASSRSSSDDWAAPPPPLLRRGRGKSGRPSSADSSSEISEAELASRGASDFLRRQRRYSPRKVMKFGDHPPAYSEDAEDSSLEPQTIIVTAPGRAAPPPRSRIPTSQSPSPQHRNRGGRLSASRSETSLFQQSPVNTRGSRVQLSRRGMQQVTPTRQRSSSTTRSVSSSPARTPEWNPKRRTLSLQSSPVKPVPPLLEEILNDSEVLDSDAKILERMERLINEYRAREASPDSSLVDDYASPIKPLTKASRRNSLSRIPVLNWQVRQ